MFLRKKESKPAPSKVQQPPRENAKVSKAKVVFEKAAPVKKTPPKSTPPKRSVPKTVESKAAESKPAESMSIKEPTAVPPFKQKYTVNQFQKQIHVILSSLTKNIKKREKKTKIIKKQSPTKHSLEDIFKRHEIDIQLALIPLILLAILSILMQLNNYYLGIITENKVPKVESVGSIQPFPLTENIIPPDISAKAAVVLDSDSQVFLLSKNPELRFSIASTTKIMTALVALDHFKDDSILTVKSSGVQGSTIGLQAGEKLTLNDLLYAMMLPSANDAAVAIADNYPEGQEAFVKKMNDKALLLHLTDTHFADSSGLNDDENYSTAVDLARLGSYAMKNKKFAKIVGTKEKTIYNTYFTKQYTLSNLNRLLGTNGVNGIKTGTTEGAGEVLITSTVINDHTFIIVVMNSTDRFSDTKILIDFIKEKVQYYVPPLPN